MSVFVYYWWKHNFHTIRTSFISLFLYYFSDTLKKDMFEEKSLAEEPPKATKSQLSQLLEDTMYQPSNPFLDYAKFDGEVWNNLNYYILVRFFFLQQFQMFRTSVQ